MYWSYWRQSVLLTYTHSHTVYNVTSKLLFSNLVNVKRLFLFPLISNFVASNIIFLPWSNFNLEIISFFRFWFFQYNFNIYLKYIRIHWMFIVGVLVFYSKFSHINYSFDTDLIFQLSLPIDGIKWTSEKSVENYIFRCG